MENSENISCHPDIKADNVAEKIRLATLKLQNEKSAKENELRQKLDSIVSIMLKDDEIVHAVSRLVDFAVDSNASCPGMNIPGSICLWFADRPNNIFEKLVTGLCLLDDETDEAHRTAEQIISRCKALCTVCFNGNADIDIDDVCYLFLLRCGYDMCFTYVNSEHTSHVYLIYDLNEFLTSIRKLDNKSEYQTCHVYEPMYQHDKERRSYVGDRILEMQASRIDETGNNSVEFVHVVPKLDGIVNTEADVYNYLKKNLKLSTSVMTTASTALSVPSTRTTYVTLMLGDDLISEVPICTDEE